MRKVNIARTEKKEEDGILMEDETGEEEEGIEGEGDPIEDDDSSEKTEESPEED